MRWLLLLLVVLNLLFYVHHLQAPNRTAKMQSPADVASGSGIRLLSETELPARRQQSHAPTGEAACLFLGGFDDVSLASALRQRLLSLDIASTLRSIDAAAGIDYWVYLPPLVSRQASLRQLRELQSRNIDSYIITVGDLANGISLGIFSRKDSAESVVNRLQEVGYQALIRELPRVHRKYWVRVEGESRSQMEDRLLQSMARDFPSLQHQQMPCSSVATSE
ncbi:SPOR domain-containing protein [Stutzerimonas nitrititolerans]|uniref:SPOR domain-containing protein n=1 Tax=Stutzerimonas nitrititolerans TaxID=2482751 RepID=UPI00289C2132|nr:SPOR domain-containing protein [Stutzerimonas nitrititolerans]